MKKDEIDLDLAFYMVDPFQDLFLEKRKTAFMAAEATLGWRVTEAEEVKKAFPPEPAPLPPSNERTLEDEDTALILAAVPELQKRRIPVTHGTVAAVTRLDSGRVRKRMIRMHIRGVFSRERGMKKGQNREYCYSLRAGRQEAAIMAFSGW